MCLLTYFPPNAAVNTDRLACGAECNPHGHGYAIVTADGQVLINHNMRPTALIAEFAELRERHPDSHALFHSRITTHGATNLANCHPFIVSGPRGGQTILAHNGILPRDCQPTKGDKRSDTRILAEDMLWSRWSKFRLPTRGRKHNPVTRQWLDSADVRADIEGWLGTGSKVLVLTTNPRMRQTAYLLNERLGEWVDGVWYSNGSFERWTSGYSGKSYVSRGGTFWEVGPTSQRWESDNAKHWWDDFEPPTKATAATGEPTEWAGRVWYPYQSYRAHFPSRRCDVCAGTRVARADYVCDTCGVCWICNEYYTDCHDEQNGTRCGFRRGIRDGFDRIVGYTWPGAVQEIQAAIDTLRAAGTGVVKSAASSALVFIESEESESSV